MRKKTQIFFPFAAYCRANGSHYNRETASFILESEAVASAPAPLSARFTAAGRDCRKPLATGEERSCGGEKERFHGKKD